MRIRSTKAAWIATYAALIAVPIFISLVVYASTSDLLRRQLDDSNRLLVALFGKELEERLDYVQRLASDIAWDQKLLYLMNKSSLSEADARLNMLKLAQSMALYKGYDRFTDSAFIYFPAFDQVLTPQALYPLPVFWEYFGRSSGLDERGLRALLSARHPKDSLPLLWTGDDGKARERVAFLWTLPQGSADPSTATVGLIINTDSVIESIRQAVRNANADIVITNEAGDTLASTLGEEARGRFKPLGESSAPIVSGMRIGGRSYTALQQKTSRLGWTVRLLVSADVLEGKLRLTRTIVCLGAALSLLLSGALAVLLFRRNYRPLESTLRSALRESGLDYRERDDEFALIRDAVTRVSEGRRIAEDRFERSKGQLRENAVDRLLKGRGGPGMPFEESVGVLGIELPSNSFMAIIVDIDEGGEDYPAAREFAHRELERGLGREARIYRSSDEDCLAYLACLEPSALDSPREKVREALAQAIAAAREEGELDLACASSLPVEGLGEVRTAYRQAQEAREYRFIVGGSEPIDYGEIPSQAGASSYSFEAGDEARLINTAASGDLEACRRIVDELFARNSGAAQATDVAKRLAWDLGSALMKAIAGAVPAGADSAAEGEALIDAVAELPRNRDMLELKLGIEAILARLCLAAGEALREAQAERKTQATQEFAQSIRDYLAQNVGDPNLNLKQIADRFSMTPAYLSRVFREREGQGVHDCLNELRVELAKSLLGDKKKTLPDIVEESGFSSVNTFIRVFKKYTGLSPGKYRETLTR